MSTKVFRSMFSIFAHKCSFLVLNTLSKSYKLYITKRKGKIDAID